MRLTSILLVRVYSRRLSSFKEYLRRIDADKNTPVVIDKPEYFNFASDVIDEWASSESSGTNRPAFWYVPMAGPEIKWNFQDLSAKSKKAANVLSHTCGQAKDDRVVMILPKVPEWWLLTLAASRIGCILSSGTSQLSAKDIGFRLSKLEATCVITDEEIAPKVDQVADQCPSLRTKLLISSNPQSTNSEWLNFNASFDHASEIHQCEKTKADDAFSIFFTSGTSGPPKMVEHSHASYGLGHIYTGKYWLDLGEKDLIWCLSDPGWAKSAYSSFYSPWLCKAGVFIHQMPRFDPKLTFNVLGKYPISVFCAPPTVYRSLVTSDLKGIPFSKTLKRFVSAGEALNPEVITEWEKGTGKKIYEGYGQTELVITCGMYEHIPFKAGSMGKPYPGLHVSILDKQGKEVPVGEAGEICLKVKPDRPIGIFNCYRNEPGLSPKVFKGDYYLTGDRGYKDEDGYIWFVSRDDDIINSAGYRIGPFEVESALMEHEAVFEAAVVASPDPQRGEVVKAFIILKDGFPKNEKLVKELQDFVKTNTAPYKYPRKIEFVDHLPKTISAKIQRVVLRNKEFGR